MDPASKTVCQTTCKDWTVKGLDCPKGGCLGFSFKVGANFKAQDQRPKPDQFPTIVRSDAYPTVGTYQACFRTAPSGDTAWSWLQFLA
jgi:hypothetical protein